MFEETCIETKIYTTIYTHTSSGDYDSQEGWEQVIKEVGDEEETFEGDIVTYQDTESGKDGLILVKDEDLAKAIGEACNKRGVWQPDSYKDGSQVEVDDGIDARTGLRRVHLEDVAYLAFCDTITLNDVTPNSCNADIKYHVVVAFSKEQEDDAMNDEGNLVPEDLDWENPMILKVKEL